MAITKKSMKKFNALIRIKKIITPTLIDTPS